MKMKILQSQKLCWKEKKMFLLFYQMYWKGMKMVQWIFQIKMKMNLLFALSLVIGQENNSNWMDFLDTLQPCQPYRICFGDFCITHVSMNHNFNLALIP